jgi:hypothetical protein
MSLFSDAALLMTVADACAAVGAVSEAVEPPLVWVVVALPLVAVTCDWMACCWFSVAVLTVSDTDLLLLP